MHIHYICRPFLSRAGKSETIEIPVFLVFSDEGSTCMADVMTETPRSGFTGLTGQNGSEEAEEKSARQEEL